MSGGPQCALCRRPLRSFPLLLGRSQFVPSSATKNVDRRQLPKSRTISGISSQVVTSQDSVPATTPVKALAQNGPSGTGMSTQCSIFLPVSARGAQFRSDVHAEWPFLLARTTGFPVAIFPCCVCVVPQYSRRSLTIKDVASYID
jgi:hypothetical protein